MFPFAIAGAIDAPAEAREALGRRLTHELRRLGFCFYRAPGDDPPEPPEGEEQMHDEVPIQDGALRFYKPFARVAGLGIGARNHPLSQASSGSIKLDGERVSYRVSVWMSLAYCMLLGAGVAALSKRPLAGLALGSFLFVSSFLRSTIQLRGWLLTQLAHASQDPDA